ncbi:MAG: hypothetical protein U1E52_07710 [Geminicoccaceae bacterium]
MRGGIGGAWAILGLWLAGCGGTTSTTPAGQDGLARYPEAEAQIRAYYASQGSGEPQHACGRGQIERIDASRIYADRPIEVIFEVDYRFTASGSGGAPCAGVARRWFTFDREADGRLSLAEMSDQAP